MSFLENLYHRFEVKITSFLSSQNWKSRVVIVAIGVMLLSFFNNLSPLRHLGEFYNTSIKGNKEYFLYQTVEDRASRITYDWTYPEFTGMNNRTFRLAMPVFVKVFHIKNVSVVLYGLQLILGVLFLYSLLTFWSEY